MSAAHTATPLRRSSHRQIVSADGGLVCEVFSGALGIDGADKMEELIVRSCNRDHLFDEMAEALTTCMQTLQKLQRRHTDYPDGSSKYEPPHHSILSDGQEGPHIDFCVSLARAALAKVSA